MGKADAAKTVTVEIRPDSIVDAACGIERGTPAQVSPTAAKRLVALTYNGQPVFRTTTTADEQG